MIHRHTTRSLIQRQHGVALITAMLVFAIATALVSKIILQSQSDIQKLHWIVDQAQAHEDALLAEQVALTAISRALHDNKLATVLAESTDYHNAPAAITTNFSQSQWQLSDLQARINLNNLIIEGDLANTVLRFMQQQSIDQHLIDSVKDWIDQDKQTSSFGAEDSYYNSLQPAGQTANQLFKELEALRGVSGFESKLMEPLMHFLTALPAATSININRAPEQVIAAIHPRIDANNIIKIRNELTGGFTAIDSFVENHLPHDSNIDPRLLTLKSTFYQLQIVTRYRTLHGDRQLILQSVLALNETGPQILNRSFGTNEMKALTEDTQTTKPEAGQYE